MTPREIEDPADVRLSPGPAVALVAALIALAVASATAWNAATQPVFAHRPHPVLAQALLYGHMNPDADLSGSLPDHPPIFVTAAFLQKILGRHYSALMAAQTLWLAALMAILAILALRIAGAWAAVWTAAIAAGTPVLYLAALGLDDHLSAMALVALAALFLWESRGGTRWGWTAAAGACAGLALHFGFVPSNGVLAAGTACAIGIGAAAEGLIGSHAGEGPPRRISRLLIGAAAFAAALIIAGLRDGSLAYIAPSYLGAETGHAPSGMVRNLLAYPYLIARYQLGPVISLLAIAGAAVLFARRERGRLLLAAWLLLPVLALIIVPKKNPYYIFYALPAAVPLAGIGLAAWARNRPRRIAVAVSAVASLAFVGVGLMRVDPESRPAAGFEDYIHEPGSFLLHAPDRRPHADRAEAAAIAAAMGTGPARWIVVPDSVAVLDELRYFLLVDDPGLNLHVIEPARAAPPTDHPYFLLVRRADGTGADLPSALRASLERIEADAARGVDTHGRDRFLRNWLDVPVRVLYTSERYALYEP